MNRTFSKQRFAVLGVSTALAAAGVLWPTGAFAAPAPTHAGVASAVTGSLGDRDQDGRKQHGSDTAGRTPSGPKLPNRPHVPGEGMCDPGPCTPTFPPPEPELPNRPHVPGEGMCDPGPCTPTLPPRVDG